MNITRKPLHLLILGCCVLTFCMTTSCGNQQTAAEQAVLYLDQFQDASDSLFSTGYVVVEDGIPSAITKDEYDELLTSKKSVSVVTNDGDVTQADHHFTVTSMSKSYAAEDTYCVSALFDCYGLASMGVIFGYTFTRSISDSAGVELSEEIQEAVFQAISDQYSFCISSTSAITNTAVFPPFSQHQYASVVFTPCIFTITGDLYQDDQIIYDIQVEYPCGNECGYLDGIYAVFEADNPESFPDIP